MFARMDQKTTIAMLCLTILLACTPILLVDTPPVQDYPNHLTRTWLLSGGADLATIDAFIRSAIDRALAQPA